jgi:hypothetical protein
MSYGRLGIAVLAAGVETSVYTVPANCVGAEVTVNLVNPGATDTTVEVAAALTGTAAAGEFIEKGVIVAALGGTLEISGLQLSPGERITIKSSLVGAVVRVSGKEISAL